MSDKVVKSDAEWRAELTPEQFAVCREKGTERAFTGAYWDTKSPGTYLDTSKNLPFVAGF